MDFKNKIILQNKTRQYNLSIEFTLLSEGNDQIYLEFPFNSGYCDETEFKTIWKLLQSGFILLRKPLKQIEIGGLVSLVRI